MRTARTIIAVVIAAGAVAIAGPATANSGTIVPNGAGVTATITGPSDSATFTFTGNAGDVVNLSAGSGTFGGPCAVSMQLTDAFGRVLAGPVCAGVSAFLGSVTLPGAGSYAAQVIPNTGGTGSVVLRLSRNAADSTITENGPAVVFKATKPGQGRDFAFTATEGDVVNLFASGGTYANPCDVSMAIADSHRRTLAGPVCAGTTAFFSSVVLPATATYLVRMAAGNAGTGTVTLTLSRNDPDATIAENGPPITFTATNAGQGRNYTFTGTDGDIVNLSAVGRTYPGNCDLVMAIVDKRNRTLAGPVCAAKLSFLGSVELPGTGTYTVRLIPNNGNTGRVKLTLSKNDPDATIAENGPPITFAATHAGQGRIYTFAGSDGDVVNLSAAAGTYPDSCDVVVSIADNHGLTLAGPVCAANTSFLGSVALPGTGTYAVRVAPNNGKTGQVRLTLSKNAADSTIAVDGAPVTFTANKPGQGRNYAFTAAAGNSVDLAATGGSFPDNCSELAAISDTFGRVLAGPACAGVAGMLAGVVVPATGTYLVQVIPSSGSKGSVQLHLTSSP